MKSAMRKAMMVAMMAVAVGVIPILPQHELQACPGCKTANETEDRRPRAYMYSILFMLGMPATVFTGFGIAFYRISRRALLEQQHSPDSGDA